MSYRLKNTNYHNVRNEIQEKSFRKKYFFFVEGEKTEHIYLKALQNRIPKSKNLDFELFDRWKAYIRHSHQLKIIRVTDNYLRDCRNLTPENINLIKECLERLNNLNDRGETISEGEFDEMKKTMSQNIGENIFNEQEEFIEQLNSIGTCSEYDPEFDELSFVIDRDMHSFSESQYNEALSICSENNYKMAISTPNFEFFLLLHLINMPNLTNEEKNNFFSNTNGITLTKLQSEVELLGRTYNKNDYDAEWFLDKFDSNYLVNIQDFSTDPIELKNSLGSHLGELIKELKDFE